VTVHAASQNGAMRHVIVLAAAIAFAVAWVAAGLLVGAGFGLTDAPRASTAAVMVVAWLPIPMALALVGDVGLREFGRRRRDATVPRAVAGSILIWLVALVACVLA
jgi:hypothetical protein